MKLKIRRSQKNSLTGKAIFMVDVMADLDGEEQALVAKYKLQKEIVYQNSKAEQNMAEAQSGSMTGLGGMLMDKILKRSFTIGNLVDGQHIECKDLAEVLVAEDQVETACKNIKKYLELAKTFDGSEVVIDIAA